MISPVGVEPTTLGLLDPRSNQLSYGDIADGLQHIAHQHVYYTLFNQKEKTLFILFISTDLCVVVHIACKPPRSKHMFINRVLRKGDTKLLSHIFTLV